MRLDAVLCFVESKDDAARDNWLSGDYGGFECYLEAEEDGVGDVAVYTTGDGDDGPLVSVHAVSNTLSLVLRDEGVMRFIK